MLPEMQIKFSLCLFSENQVKCLRNYDVVVVLDRSAKVGRTRYNNYISVTKDLIHIFNIAESGSHFALLLSNNQAKVSMTSFAKGANCFNRSALGSKSIGPGLDPCLWPTYTSSYGQLGTKAQHGS